MSATSGKGEGNVVGRLAGRGEEALARLKDEIAENPRLEEARELLGGARGRLDKAQRAALAQLNVAPRDEVGELRERVEALERRLAELERAAARPAPRRTAAKKAPAKS